jgi:hypothetical protein
VDNGALISWMNRTGYKWLSPAIQNELMSDMAQAVLRSYISEIVEAKIFAFVMDESTDVSVKEQVSVCFRYVSPDLEVHETFVGFYETPSTDVGTLFSVVTDIMKRFNLALTDCRGQCFDGASNMVVTSLGFRGELLTCNQRPYMCIALIIH